MAGRRGLGRGLGGLIPSDQKEVKERPIDIFFGGQKASVTTSSTSVATQEDPQQIDELQPTVDVEKQEVAQGKISDQEKAQDERRTRSRSATASRSTATKKKVNRRSDSAKQLGSGEVEVADNQNVSRETMEIGNDVSRETLTTSEVERVTEREEVAPLINDENELVPVPGATYGELLLDEIVPNQKQPRTVFDEDDLEELKNSIQEVGVLQPVIVRPLSAPIPGQPDARYELIMGERRWRASRLAGQETVPAIIRRTADEDLLRDALLENLHRAQLNPLEEAAAYQQLLEDFNCTQEELSRRIARSRPQITNTLRLLKLPPLVQRRVAAGVLSAGHARALLGLSDPGAMEALAQRIVAEGISVRQTEELVALGEDPQNTVKRRGRTKTVIPELREVANRLAERFDTKVKVDMGKRKGTIKIDFGSLEDLERILALFESGK